MKKSSNSKELISDNTKKNIVIGNLIASAVAIGLSLYAISTVNNVEKKQTDDFESLSQLIVLNAEDVNGSTSNKQLDDYLMANPEQIIKSLAKYRFLQEQEKNAVAKTKVQSFDAALYEDKTDPVLGNPNGKHVVVEFVDNNCGYCKALAPTLEEFVRIDPEAKVIVKEFPIFKTNPSSRYSALMGTAIWLADPSKYADFHHKAMKTPHLTNDAVDQFVRDTGISKEKISEYIDQASRQIEKNRTLGNQLEVTGTPTVFINNERMHGGFTAQQVAAMFK